MVTSTVVRGEGPDPKRVRASSVSQLSETGSDEYQEQEYTEELFVFFHLKSSQRFSSLEFQRQISVLHLTYNNDKID